MAKPGKGQRSAAGRLARTTPGRFAGAGGRAGRLGEQPRQATAEEAARAGYRAERGQRPE